MQKSLLRFIVLCAFIFCYSMKAYSQTTLRFADGLPKSFAYFGAMEAFKKDLEDNSKTLKVGLFGGGVLGDQKAIMEATKSGAIDISVIAHQVAQQLVPEYGVFGLPFVWVEYDSWIKFLKGPQSKSLAGLMETHGLKVLVFADGGSLALLNSKRPIQSPADMKGIKLRVMQDPMQIEMIEAMGGTAVPMGTTEVYTAIQQGQIDGNATGPQLLWALKNHEVARHLTFTNHGRSAAVVVMNLKKWNSLKDDEKRSIERASNSFFDADSAYFVSGPNTSNETIVGFMAKAGVVVSQPDVASFRKATAPVITRFKGKVNSEIVNQILAEAGVGK